MHLILPMNTKPFIFSRSVHNLCRVLSQQHYLLRPLQRWMVLPWEVDWSSPWPVTSAPLVSNATCQICTGEDGITLTFFKTFCPVMLIQLERGRHVLFLKLSLIQTGLSLNRGVVGGQLPLRVIYVDIQLLVALLLIRAVLLKLMHRFDRFHFYLVNFIKL